MVVGRRLGRERLRRRRLLARHVGLRDGPLLDWEDRFAGDAVEEIQERLLAHDGDRLDGTARHREVDQHRRRGDVHVPDWVVHQLEMPLAAAGPVVDGHQAFGEQVVPRPEPAVEIRTRGFHRQVCQTQLFVDTDLIPHADIAVVRPRLVLPRVVAEFARAGDGVKGPQAAARSHVEAADQALGVVVRLRRAALEHGRADHDDPVLGDRRRCVQADFTRLAIDLLALAEHDIVFQVNDAVPAERGDARAGLCVQGDQTVTGGDIQDALVAPVGPVRHAASRQLARRRGGARAFAFRMHPQQLSGRRVEGDDGASASRGGVEHAIDHQRRAFQLELGTGAEVIGLESPGHFERLEIAGGHLSQRRVVLIAQIARVRPPIARSRRLRRLGAGRTHREGDDNKTHRDGVLHNAEPYRNSPGPRYIFGFLSRSLRDGDGTRQRRRRCFC